MKLSLTLLTCASIFAFTLTASELHAATHAGQAPSGAKPAPPAAPAAPSDAQAAAKAVVRAEKPAYPLATCAVGGEALGATALDEVAGGHLVRVCSAACAEKLKAEPARYRELVTAAVVKQQKPTYPMTTCPVTGAELGTTAIDHVHGTRLVRLKDAEARAAFEKDPAAAMAKVDQALIAAQLPAYRASNCPVIGDRLDRKAVSVLYGTRLVRVCCASCVRKFNADPEKYLAILDAANAPAPAGK